MTKTDRQKNEHQPLQSEDREMPDAPKDKGGTPEENYKQLAERVNQEADREVGAFRAQGEETAERVASRSGEIIDDQLRAELSALANEAETAKSQLLQIVNTEISVEQTKEYPAAAELRQIGEQMTKQLNDLKIVQADGSFTANYEEIFEALPPKTKQGLEHMSDRVDELAESLGKDIISTDALLSLPKELRAKIISDVADSIARDNPDESLLLYSEAQKLELIPAEDGEQMKEKRMSWAKTFIWRQERLIDVQLATDPTEAAVSYQILKNRARDLGAINNVKEPYGMADAIRNGLKKHVELEGDPVAYFRGLPDETPGLQYVAHDMVAAQDKNGGKKEVFRVFGQTAPDAVIQYANDINHYAMNAWTEQEINDLVRLSARLPDAKLSILATRLIPSGADQMTLNMFLVAYAEYAPHRLLTHINRFSNLDQPDKMIEKIIAVANSNKVKLTDRLRAAKQFTVLKEKIFWGDALIALEKIQAQAARADHDPWLTDLDPLASTAVEKGILSLESREDGNLFVSFVQEFGAANLPTTFELFAALKRLKTLDDLPQAIAEEMKTAIGEKRFRALRTPEAAINALRNYRREITSSLLRDEIPHGMETAIGKELLVSLIGATKWKRDHDPSVLIDTWRKTTEEKPDITKIPDGYHEVKLTVKTRISDKTGDDISREQRAEKVVDNKDTQTRFKTFQEGFRDGSRPIQEIIAQIRAQLSRDIQLQITKFKERIATIPDKGRAGAQKNLDSLTRQLDLISSFGSNLETVADNQKGDKNISPLLVEAANLKRAGINMDASLRALSTAHISEIAPPQFVETIRKLAQTKNQASADDLISLRDFIVDYLNEHYLHPEQKQHQTGHEPFSTDTGKMLRQAWQIATKEDHPLVKAGDELRKIDRGEITEDTMEISMVPVQGPLRIFSGDIGDACYTSQHEQLANGDVPDLHTMVFVTGRGTANERLSGSVLFVDTESSDGKKTLMVRANNPRENFLQSVDGDALIAQTLAAAITIAQSKGMDRVVVPRDKSSASSSNRPDVSAYYQKTFATAPKISLKNEPETNFNGYKNWDPDSSCAVVEIWSRQHQQPS